MRALCAVLLLTTGSLAGAQPQKDRETYTLPVKVTLGDGRTVQGKVEFQAPREMLLQHTRDQITYEKLLRIADIGSIEFLQWNGRKVKDSRDGSVFEFRPAELVLTLKSGQELQRSGELPFLNEFVLSNENGRVKFFTYWLDLRKADGTWYTAIEGPQLKRKVCHKDIIKKIDFSTDHP
ncbi:MAG: hypothetical protein HS115_04360 [Spirochaetales bacterium]|nr:hypothetical protein [Spirochaetales bacterium]